MDELDIVRGLMLRTAGALPATAPLAKALLEWAEPHRPWLLPEMEGEWNWETLLAGLNASRDLPVRVEALALAGALARLLGFSPIDAALLHLMVACDRLPRVGALARLLSRHGRDLPQLLGEMAGAEAEDAERTARRGAVTRLGLACFTATREGEADVEIRWTLQRLLDRAPGSEEAMLDTLVGRRQAATLGLDAFGHVEPIDFLVRLLRGALGEGAAGVNILIYGPPGTGKTEVARTLAAAAGAVLHGVGEADEDGEEPLRWERVAALALAQRLLGGRGPAVLLFDEMEDLIGDASPSSGGDWFSRREGSKVFVNRLLEANPVPVIWTTNAIGNVDAAILRRMSFVLRLDLPSRAAAAAMLDRVAREERVTPGPGFATLLDAAPEAATVLRIAARAGKLAGEEDGGTVAAEALVCALRGGTLPPPGPAAFDLDLFETDRPVDRLFAAMADGGASDVSLLLTGPPGTGKTAFAHHLARARQAAAGQAGIRPAVQVGRRDRGANRRRLRRGAAPRGGAVVRRGGLAAVRPQYGADQLGSRTGQRTADVARPASAAGSCGDEPRGGAGSGDIAAVRLKAAAETARRGARRRRIPALLRRARSEVPSRRRGTDARRLRGGRAAVTALARRRRGGPCGAVASRGGGSARDVGQTGLLNGGRVATVTRPPLRPARWKAAGWRS